jgi:septal ring factor EnvC (AmiA/AmiB activator)
MRLSLAVLASLSLAAPAFAQAPGAADRAAAERRERQDELARIRADLERAESERFRISTEVEAMRADRAALVKAGIETAARLREAETQVAESETRLAGLD